jgi:hypothetical protein
MSQSPNSQPPLPEPESHNSATPTGQVSTQTQGNTFSFVLKTQTIKFLRGTIGVLEGVVVKLEAQPGQTAQPNWFDKLLERWSGILAKIRSLLPQSLSSLSDTALSSIIAFVCVILVWTTSSLFSGKPPQVVATAPSPDVVSTPNPTIPTPPDLVEPTPSPTIPTPPDLVEPTPSPTIPTPPELTAPAEPQSVEVTPEPEPQPEPEPTVELTPEQTLIAAIENQVALVSDRFADGLIQSIQANFEGSSLTLKVTNDWYNLKPSEQDKLAAQMLERSRELDFTRLEITDSQGTLLARSPVVGEDMVIFRRGA